MSPYGELVAFTHNTDPSTLPTRMSNAATAEHLHFHKRHRRIDRNTNPSEKRPVPLSACCSAIKVDRSGVKPGRTIYHIWRNRCHRDHGYLDTRHQYY